MSGDRKNGSVVYSLIFLVYSSSIGWLGSRPGFAVARSTDPDLAFGFVVCAAAGAASNTTADTIRKRRTRFIRLAILSDIRDAVGGRMLVRFVMLAQQILPVVVAVGRAHHHVDVLVIGNVGIGRELAQVRGRLVIELDQNDRALDAIVEDGIRVCLADPRKRGRGDVLLDVGHLH